MDEYSGRKGAAPKKGARLSARDSTKSRDQNVQLCNRIGCSGRLNPATSAQNVSLDDARVLKKPSSGWAKHGKEMGGKNSSKGLPKLTNPMTSSASSGNPSSDFQEAEVANSGPLSDGGPVQLDQKETQSGGPSTGSKRTSVKKKPASMVGSTLAGTTGSGAGRRTPQSSRQNARATTRAGPRFPPSESATINMKQKLKRSSDGESSSSSRVKQPAALAENGITISETRQAPSAQTSFKDSVSTFVRSRRFDTMTARRPPPQQRSLPTDQRNSVSATGYTHRARSFTSPGTGRNLSSPSEISRTGNLARREGFRHYNTSGIAEVLLALDRIEHDEEMSVEQLLTLESNLFLGGLSFQDQHRDMRLDIDGMSYEELLALEERMGSVSTSLSEEALAKCIKRSVYKPISSVAGFSGKDGYEDDTKCSICQEEYDAGDGMGRLHCKHSYHADCIDQWLRQKNWCPICKSSAASS